MTCGDCWYRVGTFIDCFMHCIHPKSGYLDQGVEESFECPEFIDRSLPFPDEESEKIFRDVATRIGRFDMRRREEAKPIERKRKD